MPITIPDPQINSEGYQAAIDEAKDKAEAALFAAIAELKRDRWRHSVAEASEAMRYLNLLAGEVGKLY